MSPLWLAMPADTEQLGARLGRHCPWELPGARLLYLQGELGAGKTTLVSGLLRDQGLAEPVRSPSYTLVEIYALRAGRVVHVDLYRLQGGEELEMLGLRDEVVDRTLLIVEWPERAGDHLPSPDLLIGLRWAESADPVHIPPGRECRIEARSPAGRRWLTSLQSGDPAARIQDTS